MVDAILITLWLINRSKAKTARSYGDAESAEKHAKRAKFFGWAEIVWLVISVLLAFMILV